VKLCGGGGEEEEGAGVGFEGRIAQFRVLEEVETDSVNV
jgi:hypothetical protein